MKLVFYLECLKKKLTSYFNDKIASEESEHDSELDDTCIYTENSDSEQSICAHEFQDSEQDDYDDDADPLESPLLKVPRLGVRCRVCKGKI